MYLKDPSNYVSGLVNMASSVSKYIGPSYLQADCYELKDYVDDFCAMYEIPKDIVHLEEYKHSLEELLKSILGTSEGLIEGLLHWLHREIGEVKKIYTVPDNKVLELIGAETGGYGPFYFCEDLYFIETDKMVLCLLLGNDE
ncbi:MAG: hypothetical protein IKE63_05315 [Bacilli bacterium]|nr:hypothetical protein [Bacilli bacterium]